MSNNVNICMQPSLSIYSKLNNKYFKALFIKLFILLQDINRSDKVITFLYDF